MADEDYYKILCIERDADEGTIKKAYRKLALKWHPDKNPDNKEVADANFKMISEAYDVLSDGEKKEIYDKYGKAGLTGGGGGGGGGGRNAHGYSFNFGGGHGGNAFHFRSADDIFQDFFEHDPFGEDILADFFGRRNGRDPRSSNVSRARDPFMHPFASFGMGMGGFGNGFSAFGNNAISSSMSDGFSSSSSFSSGGGSFKSSSTSTKVVNGRKVVTKKIVENGQETVEVYENNVLTKRTVNGVPQIAGNDIQGSYR